MCFFLFKQKTAYEMRISDWSSDVCSSDLWLQEQLKKRPLRPVEIVFEAQERVLQNHIRKAKLLTKSLNELGAQVAIEHFGIGSNSAQMIEHIPAQFVKFHQSFAKDFGVKETQKHMAALMEIDRKSTRLNSSN